jgi:DNA ligase (NAD+)
MDDLIALLTQHNMLYYVKASPVIADSQYDYLFDLLKTLEQSYPDYISLSSPTQRLVGQIDGFQKSSHRVPLLSLMNTYSAEDIEARRKTLFNGLEKR